jgi:hypothetical protein
MERKPMVGHCLQWPTINRDDIETQMRLEVTATTATFSSHQ